MNNQKLPLQMIMILMLTFGVLSGCGSSDSAKLEANKEIVNRFNDAVNDKKFNLLNDTVAADFVRHS